MYIKFVLNLINSMSFIETWFKHLFGLPEAEKLPEINRELLKTGAPKDELSKIKRRLTVYFKKNGITKIYIGRTYDVNKRVRQHQKNMKIKAVLVVYQTTSKTHVKKVEAELIKHYTKLKPKTLCEGFQCERLALKNVSNTSQGKTPKHTKQYYVYVLILE